jgi:hypothetical protein
MTITGDDVRAARGTESRKSFSARVGITEAKIAGIEKGRKIRDDEMVLLLPHVQPSNGNAPITPVPPPPTAPKAAKPPKAPKPPKIQVTKDPEVELIFDDVLGLDESWDDDEAWTMTTTAPAADAVVGQTYREMAPERSRLVSNSEIQTYKRCKRKWWLAFYRGLKPIQVSPTGPLQMGTRAHAALAAWYQPEGQPRTDPRDALERVLLDDWAAIESAVDSADPNAQLRLQTYAQDFKKDSDMLRAMIEGYVQWIEETGEDEDLEVVAPEAPMVARFPLETTETPVVITGRMDVRLRRRSDGARLFMDHKTVADMTSPTRVIHMNPQMKHYHLLEVLDILADRIERGEGIHYEVERTDGALYNMLRKVKRSARANPPFYQRIEVRHNKHEIAAYARELRGVIEEMIRTQAQLDEGYDSHVVAYPTPNDTCSWSCDFFAVCPMLDDGSRAEQFIENNFTKGDPYDRYPELANL